jgi:hypothetical protein
VRRHLSQADSVGNHLKIEYATTCDLDDGQVCPPWIEDNVVWHVVRRANGRTLWRRIGLGSAS